jgi:hypothetical protein
MFKLAELLHWLGLRVGAKQQLQSYYLAYMNQPMVSQCIPKMFEYPIRHAISYQKNHQKESTPKTMQA